MPQATRAAGTPPADSVGMEALPGNRPIDDLHGHYRHLRDELDAAYAAPVWDSERISKIADALVPVEYTMASASRPGHPNP